METQALLKLLKLILSFNGATTLQSWKLNKRPAFCSTTSWFQWGHDITVVETLLFVFIRKRNFLVSMGPRHYSRGNLEDKFYIDGKEVVSMGPRHYSRGNKFPIFGNFRPTHKFQWGHDITVVETSSTRNNKYLTK